MAKKTNGSDGWMYAVLGVSAFFLGRRLYSEAKTEKTQSAPQKRVRQKRWNPNTRNWQ